MRVPKKNWSVTFTVLRSTGLVNLMMAPAKGEMLAPGRGSVAAALGSGVGEKLIGVALAALPLLLIPIVGSYMKSVAMELKSPALKAASVFTFANSYLSLVLLISLLIRSGMERWWGDSLGAIMLAPFIIQKGIQILVDDKQPEFDGGEGDSEKAG